MRGPFSISAMIARQDKLVDCLVQQRAVTSSKPAFHESWQDIISIELSVLEFDLGNKVLNVRACLSQAMLESSWSIEAL
ncbi:hypothetical protein SDJN02_08382, partial [Cucurbita argyrosperma subsp. argyrosperma]